MIAASEDIVSGEPKDMIDADDVSVVQPGQPMPEPHIPSAAQVAANNLTRLGANIAFALEDKIPLTGKSYPLHKGLLRYWSPMIVSSATHKTKTFVQSWLVDCIPQRHYSPWCAIRRALTIMSSRAWHNSSATPDTVTSSISLIKKLLFKQCSRRPSGALIVKDPVTIQSYGNLCRNPQPLARVNQTAKRITRCRGSRI